MAKDAESHAADDRKERDAIEARNRADQTIYQVEKMLKEHRDKVSEADAKAVEDALEGARKAMGGSDVEAISKAIDALTQASHKLAEAMYKSASAQPGADGAGPGSGQGAAGGADASGEKKKDDVVDAEFVDVDDKK
jgi:molecular chaperone DnaK